MGNVVKFGIGFVTGRPNVCKVINNTYERLLKQIKEEKQKIEITIFILFDLRYQDATREEFYGINPEAYKNINIKYITPEDIEEEKKKLLGRKILTEEENELFFGYGHARGRNTLMYFAKKKDIDYLLFWDDDEYPVACIKDEKNDEIIWKEQNNITKHLEYIKDSDVTIGYHCGYISPIPYVEINKDVNEELFKQYIEAISNEAVSWECIKQKFEKDNGITYANEDIANGEGAYIQKDEGKGNWVAGSTLCLNLRNIDKIPAFYNPEGARGEDTFFSINLKDSKITKVPVYHFHDGFLKYTDVMKQKYPKKLKEIKALDQQVEQRFFSASRGWIKYKPLFLYVTDKENYQEKIIKTYESLKRSIPEINKLFNNDIFNSLLLNLKEYDDKVKIHYDEFIKVNEIWNKLKK